MRPLHLSYGCVQASVAPGCLQHSMSQICHFWMQFQHCLWLFCNCPSCLCICRNSSVIVIADIASTSLVMLWLMYIIHVTLRDNEEDAQNIPKAARISEFLKVGAAYHHHFLAAVCALLAVPCCVTAHKSCCFNNANTGISDGNACCNFNRSLCKPAHLALHISCASTHMSACNTCKPKRCMLCVKLHVKP